MEKIVIEKPGGYDRLVHTVLPTPPPLSDCTRVRTSAIGVNFADCVVRLGLYPSAQKYVGWPITPGFEFSGVIEHLGSEENPRGLKIGDEVMGVIRFGGYSSHLDVPLAQLFPVPRGLTLVQAGALPVASLTAFYALVELGGACAGKTVLVHSAAGGVGGAAVQMAKILGCFVVAVVGSSEKVKAGKDAGADVVIDKSCEPLFSRAAEVCPAGFDLILDANGSETMQKGYAALRPTGRLVIYGAHSMLSRGKSRPNYFKLAWDFLRLPRFQPLHMINSNKSVMAFNLSYLFEEQKMLSSAMTQVISWYESGALSVPAVQTFSLRDVAQAHAALQGGKTVGKLVLVPEANAGPDGKPS